MKRPPLPKNELAKGAPLRALSLALFRLNNRPADPIRHLDLLTALAEIAPQEIPSALANTLFSTFLATANFPAALATLMFAQDHIERSECARFLKVFGPDGSSGPVMKPPKRGEPLQEDLSPPDEENHEEKELVREALEVWEKAVSALVLPPPIQGRKIPLFRAMSVASLQELTKGGEVLFFQEGDTIIKQGEEDSSLYILLSGVLAVERENETGRVHLGHLRPGSFFGEMALVTSGPRNATLVAHEAATVIEIKWELLSSMLEKDPLLADELARYTRLRLLKNLMATSPLFRTLSAEAKVETIQAFEPRTPAPGEVIIEEGSVSPGLFLVASGEVHVLSGQGAERTLLSRLGAGAVFGEISLIRESPATATIEVNGEGVVLMHLGKSAFDRLAGLHPDLLSHVYQVALNRSETNKKVKTDVAIPAEDLVI